MTRHFQPRSGGYSTPMQLSWSRVQAAALECSMSAGLIPILVAAPIVISIKVEISAAFERTVLIDGALIVLQECARSFIRE